MVDFFYENGGTSGADEYIKRPTRFPREIDQIHDGGHTLVIYFFEYILINSINMISYDAIDSNVGVNPNRQTSFSFQC